MTAELRFIGRTLMTQLIFLVLPKETFAALGPLNSVTVPRGLNLSDTLALFIGTPVIPLA
jgi:hypothetical protein